MCEQPMWLLLFCKTAIRFGFAVISEISRLKSTSPIQSKKEADHSRSASFLFSKLNFIGTAVCTDDENIIFKLKQCLAVQRHLVFSFRQRLFAKIGFN